MNQTGRQARWVSKQTDSNTNSAGGITNDHYEPFCIGH